MKGLSNFFVLFCSTILLNCSSSESPHTASSRQPDRIEKVNDSTICHSYDINDIDTEMFYICKGDTTTHIQAFVTKFYSNYSFFNKDRKLVKMRQYLQPVGINERVNESVHFTPDGLIDTTNSTLLTFEDRGDSIRLHADNNTDIFNKTRVLVGDTSIFDHFTWKNPEKYESSSPYLTISKSLKGRKCVFQRITTDEKGADKSGYDIYFDIENLICRDIAKTLVCRTK